MAQISIVSKNDVIEAQRFDAECFKPYYLLIQNIINEDLNKSIQDLNCDLDCSAFIHFIGEQAFPNEIFNDTDQQTCEVYYSNEEIKQYWLTFSNDDKRRKFYFTPPKSLNEAAFYGGNIVLDEKERLFRTMQISKRINGLNRILTIRLNTTWLDDARREI